MQSSGDGPPDWDLTNVICLLHTLSPAQDGNEGTATTYRIGAARASEALNNTEHEPKDKSLGNFTRIFDYLENNRSRSQTTTIHESSSLSDQEKEVKWRDEVDGADLEDNIDVGLSAASLRTKNRAARRAKAKALANALRGAEEAAKETMARRSPPASDSDSSAEFERRADPVKRATDRRAIIQDILNPDGRDKDAQPPPITNRHKVQDYWPVSNPFSFKTSSYAPHQHPIQPLDQHPASHRRKALIKDLENHHPDEKKWLVYPQITQPAYFNKNTSAQGIHVFIDLSNIMVGFHEIMKMSRGFPTKETKMKRIPMDFRNLALILERGRPVAKRVLVGSDKFPVIDQAALLGYETNILERVRKTTTPKTLRSTTLRSTKNRNGFHSTTSGASSGSETNNPSSSHLYPSRFVEQAVDEILHLKILESIIDSLNPSTIVLATGDAAEAEYSGGFLRMVERALEKGWMVELVSFTVSMSRLYKRSDFRKRWGPMFKYIELDRYAEALLDVDMIKTASNSMS